MGQGQLLQCSAALSSFVLNAVDLGIGCGASGRCVLSLVAQAPWQDKSAKHGIRLVTMSMEYDRKCPVSIVWGLAFPCTTVYWWLSSPRQDCRRAHHRRAEACPAVVEALGTQKSLQSFGASSAYRSLILGFVRNGS